MYFLRLQGDKQRSYNFRSYTPRKPPVHKNFRGKSEKHIIRQQCVVGNEFVIPQRQGGGGFVLLPYKVINEKQNDEKMRLKHNFIFDHLQVKPRFLLFLEIL